MSEYARNEQKPRERETKRIEERRVAHASAAAAGRKQSREYDYDQGDTGVRLILQMERTVRPTE